MSKKYEISYNDKKIISFIGDEHNPHTVFRIKAIKDIDLIGLKAGDLGGYVEKEENLSQEGNSWIDVDAIVFGNAHIVENALIKGTSVVGGNARISGDAKVYDNARVLAHAEVNETAEIYGNAVLLGNAVISGKSKIFGDVIVDLNNIGLTKNIRIYSGEHCCRELCEIKENPSKKE